MAWTETNTADDGTKVEEWQWASQGYYVFLVHYRLYRPISIFNCNPLLVQTNFSPILDPWPRSNLTEIDKTDSVSIDMIRIHNQKPSGGSEKWL